MKTLILFVFLGFISAICGQEEAGDFRFPVKPANGILDPTKWLTSDAAGELEKLLLQARDEWEVEVFLVVFPSAPPMGREAFVKRMESDWVRSGVWGVVFYFLDDAESPYFHAARGARPSWNDEKLAIFDQAIAEMVVEVGERARRTGGTRQVVAQGTRELAEELWYLGTVMERNTNEVQRMRGEFVDEYRAKLARKEFLKKVLMAGIPLFLVAMGIGIYWLKTIRKRRRVGFLFPETSPQVRFLAPWSGGNDVLVHFATKIGKNGSRKG